MAIEPQAALDKPRGKTNDAIWMIVIKSLAVTLVIAVSALAISMFIPPATGGTSGQVMLTVITTVVGFLGGLFTTSPVSNS